MSRRILSEIWIYPVKSLGGIRVPSARVMEKGLQHDRRWMLIDDAGRFLTQRKLPMMALFKVGIQGSTFVVTQGSDFLELPDMARGPGIRAQIWNDAVDITEPSTNASRWFTDKVGFPCRLVIFPEANPRPIDPKFRISTENVSLADGYPILIIGQSSLDDLNRRLEHPVPMNRFRPNLVFVNGDPYEEDNWRGFRVGSNRFAGVKPCSRCALTTIDQASGEVGKEPLLTLSRYRKRNEGIFFGQNVIPIDYNEIHERDEITFE